METIVLEVLRVKVRKDGVKYLTIPQKSKLNGGQLVLVTDKLGMADKYKKGDKNVR